MMTQRNAVAVELSFLNEVKNLEARECKARFFGCPRMTL
jgi:hypothetical protein